MTSFLPQIKFYPVVKGTQGPILVCFRPLVITDRGLPEPCLPQRRHPDAEHQRRRLRSWHQVPEEVSRSCGMVSPLPPLAFLIVFHALWGGRSPSLRCSQLWNVWPDCRELCLIHPAISIDQRFGWGPAMVTETSSGPRMGPVFLQYLWPSPILNLII